MESLFDRLESDWLRLAATHEARDRLWRWAAADPALAQFADLADLVESNRTASPRDANAVLAALAAHAGDDALAARTLLQLLVPGCQALSRRVAWLLDDREEREAVVVAAVYGCIRAYPIERRPQAIAANVLLDAAKAIRRSLPPLPAAVPLDHADLAAGTDADDQTAAEELLELIATAVRVGHIDAADAQAIAMTRVGDITVEEVALRQNRHPGSVRRRRRAAETRLALLAA